MQSSARDLNKQWIAVPGICAVGFVVRLYYLLRTEWMIDADEAITGLMGRHIASGIRKPIFYYGQDYLGSMEAWLDAGIFRLFGSSLLTIKIVPLLFGLLIIVTFFMLADRLFGRTAAYCAAILAAVPPVFFVMYQTKAWMGHMEMVVFGNLALLQTHRLIEDRRNYLQWSWLGFLFGFGFWISPLMLVYILTASLLLLGYRRLSMGSVASIVIAGIVGAAPFVAYNIKHPMASLTVGGLAHIDEMPRHLVNFFTVGLPIILGARQNRSNVDIWPGATIALIALFSITIILLIKRFRESKAEQTGVMVVIVLFVLSSALFIVSRYGFWALEPRYMVTMNTVTILSTAAACDLFWRKNRLYGLMFLLLLLSVNLVSIGSFDPASSRPVVAGMPVELSDKSLIKILKDNDIRYAKANYWIAYRLTYETNEQIICAPAIEGAPSQDRFAQYVQDVAGSDDVAYIMMRTQRPLAGKYRIDKYRRLSTGNYDIYIPRRR